MEETRIVKTDGRSLEKVVDEAMTHLKSLGYRPSTLAHHQRVWTAFTAYACGGGAHAEFSVEKVERFLASQAAPVDGAPESFRSSLRHLQAAMRILMEFALHGCFQRRRNAGKRLPLPAHWQEWLGGYERFCCEERRAAPRSLRVQRRDLHRFLHFLEARHIHGPGAIDAAALSTFVGTFVHVRPKTVATTVSTLRAFLRYLVLQGVADGALIEQVPKVRVYQGERLPTIWKPQQALALLAAVDRASPLGKRDYAILLLAARLGLRAGDIRDLRIEQIDWDRACIHVRQAKTKVPLELPLSEEVGQSLIDYLRLGRPPCAYREVFVRHHAPFAPFGRDNNLHSIITAYRRKAGVELPRERRSGLHSLRHTLASRLLEVGTPLDTIAGTLGHLSPETTRLYLRIDVEALRHVALDPEEVHHG
jgi:integrase